MNDREMDARIRAAFGDPPDFAGMATRATTRRPVPRARRRIATAAALAGVVLLAVGAWQWQRGRPTNPDVPDVELARAVDAAAVWQELAPTASCMAPRITRPDELASHCQTTHGSEVRVDVSGPAEIHGPTTCASLPQASVLTVIYPPGPGLPADVRTLLIGVDVPVRPSSGIRAFQKELRGVGVVELTTAPAARALDLLR
jgi:hypothetical protein